MRQGGGRKVHWSNKAKRRVFAVNTSSIPVAQNYLDKAIPIPCFNVSTPLAN